MKLPRRQLLHLAAGAAAVAFGSKADIAAALQHVRFTPESGHHRPARHVRLVPKADIRRELFADGRTAGRWSDVGCIDVGLTGVPGR